MSDRRLGIYQWAVWNTICSFDDEENHYVAIDAEVGIFSGLHLVIVNPRQGASCTYIDAVFDREDLEDGEAYITRMDGTIISGTFSGGSIKEGRFDIKYREKPEGGSGILMNKKLPLRKFLPRGSPFSLRFLFSLIKPFGC